MTEYKYIEPIFVVAAALLLITIPYYTLNYQPHRDAVAINVVGYNPFGLEPGVWLINEGGWNFRDTNKKKNEIVVTEGETVTLYITSVDLVHGFYLPFYNISEMIYPGKVKIVKFVADHSGEFPFRCNVRSCGFGHLEMKGKLIVEPR
ncbi:MAG: hypothetical protein V3T58_07590 [Candidatus Hydrothermarchaeales archaeon]